MEQKYIVWNEEKSNRLYDFVAQSNISESMYFGYQVGRGIVNFCKYFVPDIQTCKCLDYGCGLGHIIGYFLEEDICIYGVDMSQESVNVVNKKFEGRHNWGGAKVFDGKRLPYEDDTFDLITCTEVIEHILPKHMELFLSELKRILKPDGKLLLTTPNDEDFSKNEVCCPECNTIFHKHGHCNKFTVEDVNELMKNHGYRTIMCNATDFWKFQKNSKTNFLDLSIRKTYRILKRKLINMFDTKKNTIDSKIFQENMRLNNRPNLFWIGTK